jgi:hypothetical protein
MISSGEDERSMFDNAQTKFQKWREFNSESGR